MPPACMRGCTDALCFQWAIFGLQAWKASQLQLFLLLPYKDRSYGRASTAELAAAAVLGRWERRWEWPQRRDILRVDPFDTPNRRVAAQPWCLFVARHNSPVTSLLVGWGTFFNMKRNKQHTGPVDLFACRGLMLAVLVR